MKKILIGLAALIVVILLIAAVAPKDFKIEKSITINKPKAEVFAYLKMLQNAKNWEPWSKMDPDMKVELKGVDGTVGAISSWSGNKEVGSGEQEIKNISENEKIDFELRFSEPMKAVNTAYYTTQDAGENQTQVTWAMQGKTPYPMNLLCLIMKGKVEKNFEQGLANLKIVLETPAAPATQEESSANPADVNAESSVNADTKPQDEAAKQ